MDAPGKLLEFEALAEFVALGQGVMQACASERCGFDRITYIAKFMAHHDDEGPLLEDALFQVLEVKYYESCRRIIHLLRQLVACWPDVPRMGLVAAQLWGCNGNLRESPGCCGDAPENLRRWGCS